MKIFNESLTNRYNTLERNIKSKSNSFYDSYLDLLEATIKYFLDENNISYDDSRTCGHLVKSEKDVIEFLRNKLKLDDYTFNKIPDYIKKCNDHKHKKEKLLGIDSVINYLKVYFDLVNFYIDYIKGIRIEYNAEYYTSIFGETERLNNEFKLEVARLKEELQDSIESHKLSEQDMLLYKSLLSEKEIEVHNLDEQNKILQGQISVLKDIKLNSMEEKLNKTLELLMNLTDSVVENRAVSIAIGETIIGGDITKTEYMNKAKKSIEEKNQNLFDKINDNATELARLSGKFSKVELDDLCKLADRTLKAKDFEGAKKLYNQVLLLNPNDWKAEYFVTALNLYGSHYHSEFAFTIEFRDKLYEKTFENVMNLKANDEDKISELTEAFKLIDDDLDVCIDHTTKRFNEYKNYIEDRRKDYEEKLKNKILRSRYEGKTFEEAMIIQEDEYLKAYFGVELATIAIIKAIEKIPYQQFKEKSKHFAEIFMNYVNNLKLNICSQITEDDLNNIISLSNISFNYKYSFETYKRGRKE